ncbi:hypothetical protein PIROE2DRAFT_15705 [Piromyces sp. E2]|nr:hypothetical protein PIROE2DRAFT_15705 [Piromyces sp. E2]|eukprot:OUM58919.1 hypothetical protein PIROE2DRAFT_15705 [Piromyces sp. E2]
MSKYINSKIAFKVFKELYNEIYFVDKSNIINDFNKLLNKKRKYVCITKPRRFGKSSIATMLVSYYSKSVGTDFKEIFDYLEVSKGKSIDFDEKEREIKQYKKNLGSHHTIYINFLNCIEYNSINEYISLINKEIKNDIENLYPHSKTIINYSDKLSENLLNLYLENNAQFIFIIDEWDCMFNNLKFSDKEKDEYIDFLNVLLNDQPYVTFAFMTGILPISKKSCGSALNCFKEYSMLNDEKYYKYFGFTEKEVQTLCDLNGTIKYKDIKNWYNGYKSNNGEIIFNPWSVCNALEDNIINNYWIKTGPINEVANIIDFSINGVKEDILKLIIGDKIPIELEGYDVEDEKNKFGKTDFIQNDSDEFKKEKLYSAMVAYGLLTYYDGKIFIPNKEIFQIFKNSLRKNNDLIIY